jgi:hypothetical protein
MFSSSSSDWQGRYYSPGWAGWSDWRFSSPVRPSCSQYFLEVEADGAAELEAGELAALPLVEDRRRLKTEVVAELAGGK